jgi:hypothetical protein
MENSPKRRSLRLPQYDYSQSGAYFVTLISHQRLCVFGDIQDGLVILSELGMLIQEEWFASEGIRSEI